MQRKSPRSKRMDVPLELKAVGEDGTFSGYGSVFDIEDLTGDIVAAGAFVNSLNEWAAKGRLPAMLWGHDSAQPIGVYTKMYEDAHGLFVEGLLLKDDVVRAREAYALLKAGAVGGLSIGYCARVEEWNKETFVRTLKDVDLWEVSLVTFPANPDARVTTVKAASIKTIRDFEAALRDELGFSHARARAIASHGFKSAEPRDEDVGLDDVLASVRRAAGIINPE